jgi:hypothetical protein
LNIAVHSQPLQHFRYGRLSHSKTSSSQAAFAE